MEDIIVKHLRLLIDTDKECHKKYKNNLNTYLYSKICRIVEEELEKNLESLYNSFTENELPTSSTNIVIKEIKIKLETIHLGKYFLKTFARQLYEKLHEEFNNNVKEEFKEQHNINSQLYIERVCNDIKDFLFDGCIENEKEYRSLIKNYESILDMHLQYGNNKIKTSFGFKDFLALCFYLPNAYRRFIRVFPKNIIEKTIYFLFKDDSLIFYNIVDEVTKILTKIKENKTVNYTFKVTDILSATDKSTVSSLEDININEDLKDEIYASIFEHYESLGYVKKNDFLSSLINIINVKSKTGFNLSIKDDNVVVIKQEENEQIEKTEDRRETLSEKLYNVISNARSGDFNDTRTLLTFLENNNNKLKDSALYCDTESIITLLRDVNFEDLDISPLIRFTNEDIIDSYALLRKIFKGKEEYVNKHTVKFICNHGYSKDHNADDIKKSYFLSVVNSLVKTKDELKIIEKQFGEYEESRLLDSVFTGGAKKSTNINNDFIDKCISEINETTNTTKEKKEIESILLESENNSDNTSQENDSISIEKEEESNNTLLEKRNNNSNIKTFIDENKYSFDLCTNIISQFLEQQGVSLQKTDTRMTDDNNTYFSPLSSYVITLLLQFKNGLSLVSLFYDFLNNEKKVQSYNHNILDKVKDEIHSFATSINYINDAKRPSEQVSIDAYDSFLWLNITVLQLSFRVYNKFMFAIVNDKQNVEHAFANIYNFLSTINNKKVIDPVILLKDIKEKETINTLDKCLTDVLKEEIFNTSQTLIIGKLKMKNKNKTHLKKIKSLLNNTEKNIPKTYKNISGDDDHLNKNISGDDDHLNKNLTLNIGIDDVTSFLQDPYNCNLSKTLNLALENNDVHIVDEVMSFVSSLNIERQCSFFKTLFNTEYNKIVDMVVTGKRATITSTFLYNFIKKRKNYNKNGHWNLLLPILLYLLNSKETIYNKNQQYEPEKNINNNTSINSKLDEDSYSENVRNIKTILHNDRKYNDNLLTNFIKQECKSYSQMDNVNVNTSKDILAALYLHKIINLNNSVGVTYEPNEDINALEQKLFKNDVEDNTSEMKENHNHNEDKKEDNTSEMKESNNQSEDEREDEYNAELVKEVYVRNGGLIFLYPFFVKYLSELSLWDIEKHNFVDEYSKNNAIHSLQYIINSKTDNVEWRVILNKLLCGCEYNENIYSGYIFDDDKEKKKQQLNKIKKLSVEIIRTCIKQWEKLQKLKRFKEFARGITVKNFKEYFLNRSAIIKVYRMTNGRDSFFSYLIELSTKIYDKDIATIPWIIDKIQLPWMEKPIYVTNLIIKYKKE